MVVALGLTIRVFFRKLTGMSLSFAEIRCLSVLASEIFQLTQNCFELLDTLVPWLYRFF